MSGFACPECAGAHVRLATVAERFFYLRCEACLHVWSHPERRLRIDRRDLFNPRGTHPDLTPARNGQPGMALRWADATSSE